MQPIDMKLTYTHTDTHRHTHTHMHTHTDICMELLAAVGIINDKKDLEKANTNKVTGTTVFRHCQQMQKNMGKGYEIEIEQIYEIQLLE